MVGSSHEALHRIFQKDPAVLTKALQRVLHVPFPEPREIVATLMRAETDEGTYLLRTGADRSRRAVRPPSGPRGRSGSASGAGTR